MSNQFDGKVRSSPAPRVDKDGRMRFGSPRRARTSSPSTSAVRSTVWPTR